LAAEPPTQRTRQLIEAEALRQVAGPDAFDLEGLAIPRQRQLAGAILQPRHHRLVRRSLSIQLQPGEHLRHIAVIQLRHDLAGLEQYGAGITQIHALDLCQGLPGLQHQSLLRIGARNERRRLQVDVHPLRPVLEIPVAALVVPVVAVDKAHQRRVGQLVARRIGLLRRFVAHAPAAARIQCQPAVAVRHVRPLGHCLFYDIVHGLVSIA
jgi:hypothetical protein